MAQKNIFEPLRILFLGGNMSKDLSEWFKAQGEEVLYKEEKIYRGFAEEFSPGMIISYNYRHILKKDILSLPEKGVINLHVSYLPWNKGVYPNIWSVIDGTPK